MSAWIKYRWCGWGERERERERGRITMIWHRSNRKSENVEIQSKTGKNMNNIGLGMEGTSSLKI